MASGESYLKLEKMKLYMHYLFTNDSEEQRKKYSEAILYLITDIIKKVKRGKVQPNELNKFLSKDAG